MGFDWSNMLGGWQWALLGAVPLLLVALFFLKRKRQPLKVSSTLLWSKALEDLRADRLWQRLRRNWLLPLQLLMVGVLMLAVLRPGLSGSRLAGRTLFLIDRSASMSATDRKPTRLDEAKRRVAAWIDAMAPGDEAMFVAFADRAEIVQPFTSDRQDLERSLGEIRVTDRPGAFDDALRVARDLAKATGTERASRLVVVSDAHPDPGEIADAEALFVPIGSAEAENVGIVGLATSTRDPDSVWLDVQVENFGHRERPTDLSLLLDEHLADARRIAMQPGQTAIARFQLDHSARTAEVRLDGQDDFALDDRAWAVLEASRLAEVLLVTPSDTPLAVALATERVRELAHVRREGPEFLAKLEYARAAAGGSFDLVIYDRCRPAELPQANTLFVGSLPPGDRWSWKEPAAAVRIADVRNSHPLLHGLDLSDVLFAETRSLVPPIGSQRLVESDQGTLLAIARRGGYEDVVLSVEIERGAAAKTNWPLKPSFPAFVLNMLDMLGQVRAKESPAGFAPGMMIALRPTTRDERLTVVDRAGNRREVRRDLDGYVRFSTDGLGLHELRDQTGAIAHFAVNLLDRSESALAGSVAATPADDTQGFAGSTDWHIGRQDLWRPLVVAALAILLLEWYIYNHRGFVRTPRG